MNNNILINNMNINNNININNKKTNNETNNHLQNEISNHLQNEINNHLQNDINNENNKINDYINEYDAFMSLNNLSNKIINPTNINFNIEIIENNGIIEKGRKLSTRSKIRVRQNKKNLNNNYVDYSQNYNVLFAIQNNEKFLNLIKLISKPIHPNMYLYTEDDSIVCVIASSSYYPIIIARFMVQEPHIYLQNSTKLCIKFPYSDILTYIHSTEKINYNYSILFIREDNNFKIEYHNSNNTIINSTKYITLIDSRDKIYDEIFENKLIDTCMPVFDSLIDQNEQKIKSIYNNIQTMKVLFLTEYSPKINFTKHLKNDLAQYILNISDNEVTMEINVNKEKSIIKIASMNTSQNDSLLHIQEASHVIYWNKKFNNTKIKFINYINIFKSPDKLPSSNDMIYYAICKYDLVENLNTYAFIKIIINKNISGTDTIFNNEYLEAPIFNNIFNKIDYIYEFTMCIEI